MQEVRWKLLEIDPALGASVRAIGVDGVFTRTTCGLKRGVAIPSSPTPSEFGKDAIHEVAHQVENPPDGGPYAGPLHVF